jgi:hypothetical protein
VEVPTADHLHYITVNFSERKEWQFIKDKHTKEKEFKDYLRK